MTNLKNALNYKCGWLSNWETSKTAVSNFWLFVRGDYSTYIQGDYEERLSIEVGKEGTLKRLCTGFFYGIFMHGVGTVVTTIKKLSVLMLCEPNDCQQPFCKWWTSSISRFVCFLVKKHEPRKVYWIWQVATVRLIHHNVGSALKELSCWM